MAKAAALTLKAARVHSLKTQEKFGVAVSRTGQEISNLERLKRCCPTALLLACLKGGDLWVWGVLWRQLVRRRVPWKLPPRPRRLRRGRLPGKS